MPRQRSRNLALMMVLAGSSLACHAEGFAFSVTSPDFTISLPNIPPIRMEEHPLHGAKPYLRYMGSDGPYSVSVITPTADGDITAAGCAGSMMKRLVARPGVPPQASIYRARVNDRTYAAIYAMPGAGQLVLHAHFLSATTGGTHCIEVHVSKIAGSKDDIAPWFKDIGAADIESK